jgi:4-amino-4-deoxy-L-arabinose transferase-like glycosyltransferase
MSQGNDRRPASGLARGPVLASGVILFWLFGAWADTRWGWFEPAFRLISKLFYEQWALADLRRPSQIALARWHLSIALVALGLGLVLRPRLTRHAWLVWLAFLAGYAIRAGCWILGSNLPLVPGDSCHYIEVATSVYRGEGPVKHYVESYFRDYRPLGILDGKGVLDDWATPLWAYVLAGAYFVTGVVPGTSLEATFAVAKGTSFVLNLLVLPLIYGFARRHWGPATALGALALTAVLPVHAIYAGFALRESLVAFTAVAAVWCLAELVRARGAAAWTWALAAGVTAGLAILARDSMIALVGAAFFYAIIVSRRTHLWPLLLAVAIALLTIAPWAWITYRVYGEPFYSYTKYFAYNFSWTVHHFDRGNTQPSQFFTARNLPEIARVKVRALGIIAVYSSMILSVPVVLGFVRGLARSESPESANGCAVARLVAFVLLAFVAATLVRVADVTQVEQLGRYYLPVYLLMIPCAVAGMRCWLDRFVRPGGRGVLFAGIVALLWADPSWAYDAVWFRRPFQLHWPALVEAGRWIHEHPADVPPASRILTWLPWELRVCSDRTTILFPRALEGGAYEQKRISDAMAQYRVSHVLWGSFEAGPDSDPETLGPYLDALRKSVVLGHELYRSPKRLPYPVRLYSVEGQRP